MRPPCLPIILQRVLTGSLQSEVAVEESAVALCALHLIALAALAIVNRTLEDEEVTHIVLSRRWSANVKAGVSHVPYAKHVKINLLEIILHTVANMENALTVIRKQSEQLVYESPVVVTSLLAIPRFQLLAKHFSSASIVVERHAISPRRNLDGKSKTSKYIAPKTCL